MSWIDEGLASRLGKLRALAALVAFGLVACSATGCSGGADEEEDQELAETEDALTVHLDLQDAVAALGRDVQARSPGTRLSISVRNLVNDETATFEGDDHHISASAAKAMWVAAALDRKGVAPVAPYAGAIFRNSDNEATGAVIRLIGPEAENTFYQQAGMKRSGFTRWCVASTGPNCVADNSPGAMGSDNYFTANDAVGFLNRLDGGDLLAKKERATLLDWMKDSPRSGANGGWLGTRLPAAARIGMMHKAGWLPPGCCSSPERYNTLNEIGIVPTPDGGKYAVAILAEGGRSYWNRQAPFVEYASCVIYRAIIKKKTLSCAKPQ